MNRTSACVVCCDAGKCCVSDCGCLPFTKQCVCCVVCLLVRNVRNSTDQNMARKIMNRMSRFGYEPSPTKSKRSGCCFIHHPSIIVMSLYVTTSLQPSGNRLAPERCLIGSSSNHGVRTPKTVSMPLTSPMAWVVGATNRFEEFLSVLEMAILCDFLPWTTTMMKLWILSI